MKRIILIISISVFSFSLFSQNSVDRILEEVAKNNTTLIALRKSVDAQKIGNKTGIYLQNPEIGFNYLWGNPSANGNRTDFNITQSFDFPTAYGFKNQISDLKNQQTELEYQKQLMAVQLKTSMVCFDLIYTNALISELSKRVEHSQSIAKSYKVKFENGETNILEYNKSQLNLLNVSKELESVGIERNALLAELIILNGGEAVDFTESVFQITAIPEDFDQMVFARGTKSNFLAEKVIEIQPKNKPD
ncbi:MAG: TolC family protein [Saprospiraceae bacterium]|nr:TolC family protein [Saprospiraceae bacterium]